MQGNKPDIIVLYGVSWCPDCKRSKRFFGENRVEYEYVDIEQDSEAMAYVEQVNHGLHSIPTIVFPDGVILVEPTNAQLAEKLGMQTRANRTYYDVIIVGGGPAGLTTAVYLGRDGYEVLVIERSSLGGQAGITHTLDNFPGFPEGVTGAEFAIRLERQARRFGVEIMQAQQVKAVDRDPIYLRVTTSDGSTYSCKAVLLATGARYRRLDVPGERDLIGVNIHFCATCDGAFYKGRRVLVVGGGDSGFEEGLFLTRFASTVDIMYRAEQPKANKTALQKVAEKPNIKLISHHIIKSFSGKQRLESLVAEDISTGQQQTMYYDGVFVFVGLQPNNDSVKDKVQLDANGFIITSTNMMTSMQGVFAAGDVRAGATHQAASAAGEGASAAIMIREYLRQVG